MHDRLRLDVAVSQGQEIYSWHGENNFSASNIRNVVSSGPISSGGFVGYLSNVFGSSGVTFTYTGTSGASGADAYTFNYSVPLNASRYHVQNKHGSRAVPFHGSFSADTAKFELTALEVIADQIPDDSDICSADTSMTYQLSHISGRDALIPALFILRIDDFSHVYTVSRNEYSQCREFRGESTLRFDAVESGGPSAVPATPPEWLPAGITLRVALRAPIDEKTAYTGDSVEGVLVQSVKIPGTKTTIPKTALLKGVITRLEDHYKPERHYFVSIEFQRLTFGNRTFLLRGLHKPSGKEGDKLYFLFGDPLPAYISEQLQQGTIIFDSRRLRLDQRFLGEWETTKPAPNEPAESNIQ